jgi:hypothetical protein
MPAASDLGIILALGLIVVIAIEIVKVAFRTNERASRMSSA